MSTSSEDESSEVVMSDEHINILTTLKNVLADRWNIDAVLDALVSRHVLTHVDEQKIRGAPTGLDKVNMFLKIFMMLSNSAFSILISVLRENNQKHIAKLINEGITADAGVASSGIQLKDYVEEILECQYGLLTRLREFKVLTDRDVDAIKAKRTSFTQNNKLIAVVTPRLQDMKKCESFLKALCDTGQGHVAKYITESIGPLDKDRPLTDAERENIIVKTTFLMSHLQTDDGLLDLLFSTSVLTEIHLTAIRSCTMSHDRIEKLLEIIKRRSFIQYAQFLVCLENTKQHQVVAHILKADGVVTAVDAPQVNQQLADLMIDIFRLISTNEDKKKVLQKLLSIQGVDIASLSSKCVRLFFLCRTLKELYALREKMNSGLLKSVIEKLFSYLLSEAPRESDQPTVTITLQHLHFVDYCKCEEFLIKHHGREELGYQNMPSEHHPKHEQLLVPVIPSKLWETVLLKSAVLTYGSAMKTCNGNIKGSVYETIASVCSGWRSLIASKNMSVKIERQIIRFGENDWSLQTPREFFVIKHFRRILSTSFVHLHLTTPKSVSRFHTLMDRLDPHLILLIYTKLALRLKQLDSVLTPRLSTRLRERNKLILSEDTDEQRFVEGPLEATRTHLKLQHAIRKLKYFQNLPHHETIRDSALLMHPDKSEKVITELKSVDQISTKSEECSLDLEEAKETGSRLFLLRSEDECLTLKKSSLSKTIESVENPPGEFDKDLQIKPELESPTWGTTFRSKMSSYRVSNKVLEALNQAILTNSAVQVAYVMLKQQQKQLMTHIKLVQKKENTSKRQQELQQLVHRHRQLQISLDHLRSQIFLQERCEQLTPVLALLQEQLGVELTLLARVGGDQGGGCVTGVAELGDNIFVAHIGLHVLSVYNRSTFERLSDVILKPRKKTASDINITDMTSCRTQNCLYLYDRNNEVIWRVKDGGRGIVEKWLSIKGKNYNATLTTTSDAQLLLSGSEPSRLDIYGSNSSLSQTVKLPTDIEDPLHAVETPSGDFIVLSQHKPTILCCHRIGTGVHPLHYDEDDEHVSLSDGKVFLIDKQGHIITSMSLGSECDYGHVAVDGKGNVFVTGCELLVLDPKLSKSIVLEVMEHNRRFVLPYSVYYSAAYGDDEMGRLIIEYTVGPTEVFSITSTDAD